MATIDILLPVRNALPFLAEAVDSILAQNVHDWRLLILDHGSTDGSVDVAERYAERDSRIVPLSSPAASGLAGLLNFGLGKADARIVVRQDGDDISLPNRFQKIIEAFDADPDLLLVGSEAAVMDARGSNIGYLRRPGGAKAVEAACFFYNPIAHPTAAINFTMLGKSRARYGVDFLNVLPSEQSLKVTSLAEDYYFFGQLALIGRCINLTEPLIRYRYHDKSESVSKRVAQNDCALAISRFLAASFSALKDVTPFDPTPFCSHAENVFDFGKRDYSAEYKAMATSLETGLGSSSELARELAFRRILSTRRSISMSLIYAKFVTQHGFRKDEWRVVRNWLARFASDKYVTRVNGDRSR
jgi:glycosyltransferase involved in cell wall biosynthesis